MRFRRGGDGEDRREAASGEAANSPGAVSGQVVDLRGNGSSSVVEVRVPREEAGRFYTGQQVLLDGRPEWYVLQDVDGGSRLHRRGEPERDFRAIFPGNWTDADNSGLARRICDLLNEHGGPTGGG